MSEEDRRTIGRRIMMAVEWREISLSQLANELDELDVDALDEMVAGYRFPNSRQLISISRVLDVSVNWLLSSLDWVNRVYTDYENYGHAIKCPKCGEKLTSLLLCTDCGERYRLVKQKE